jgi:hypothetical protein
MITAGQEDAYLNRFYAIEWRFIPYLAMDLAMTPIALATGVYQAANILVALSFLLWLTAAMLIHRALHGTYSYLPLFAGLFLYNGVVNLGFINYFFSAGLALLAFAGWILWREKPVWFLFLFLLLASWVVFVGHLVAFGVLCLLIGSYEVGRCWGMARSEQKPPAWRSILLWLLPLSLPFIWLAVSAPAGHGNLDVYFGGLRDKIGAMISPTHMLSAYGRAGVVVFGATIVMLYLGVRWRRIAFARDLKLTLLLLLCGLFATPSVLFGVEFVDLRLPFIFWLLLACSIVYRPSSRREGLIVAAALAALVIVRVGIVAKDWSRFDADYKELFRASAVIPEGSRVLATCDCDTNQNWRLKLHVHSTALLVIERKIFSPTLFTGLPILKVRAAAVRSHKRRPCTAAEHCQSGVASGRRAW